MVDALPGLLERFPADLPLVVVDAYLAVFLPAGRRARLAAILAAAGRARPVTWLSLDPLVPLGPGGRDSVQGLPLPGWLVRDYQRSGVFAVLGARTFHRGAEHGELLARAHPSGQWLDWLAASYAGRLARAPPTAISATDAAARPSPASRILVSRSPSSTRASRIVSTGYSDVMTAVTASRPSCVATK